MSKLNCYRMIIRLFVVILLILFSAHTAFGAPARTRTVRIAYLENGPHWSFTYTYAAFQRIMARYQGISVIYPIGMHLSTGWLRPPTELEADASKLMENKNVDLIIAAGTSAVRALQKVNNGKTPVIGVALDEPVAAGIMVSMSDSGIDNFTCEVSPERWSLILRVFYEIVGFKKLGVLNPDVPEGRFYAGVDEAEAVSKELGFEVLVQEIPSESVESCEYGLRLLAEAGVDAFYLGSLNCFDWEQPSTDPARLLSQINNFYHLPSLSRDGAPMVRGGALMGYSVWDVENNGKLAADAAWRVLSGEKPRNVKLVIPAESRLALNLETSLAVGVDLPFYILLAADEIYETIQRPDMKKLYGGTR